MLFHINRERIVCGLVIVLSVIALTLVIVSPPSFLNNRVVYQAF